MSVNCKSITSFVRFKEEDENQLQREYENMLAGLRKASEENDADMVLANPILPEDVLKGKMQYFSHGIHPLRTKSKIHYRPFIL